MPESTLHRSRVADPRDGRTCGGSPPEGSALPGPGGVRPPGLFRKREPVPTGLTGTARPRSARAQPATPQRIRAWLAVPSASCSCPWDSGVVWPPRGNSNKGDDAAHVCRPLRPPGRRARGGKTRPVPSAPAPRGEAGGRPAGRDGAGGEGPRGCGGPRHAERGAGPGGPEGSRRGAARPAGSAPLLPLLLRQRRRVPEAPPRTAPAGPRLRGLPSRAAAGAGRGAAPPRG